MSKQQTLVKMIVMLTTNYPKSQILIDQETGLIKVVTEHFIRHFPLKLEVNQTNV